MHISKNQIPDDSALSTGGRPFFKCMQHPIGLKSNLNQIYFLNFGKSSIKSIFIHMQKDVHFIVIIKGPVLKAGSSGRQIFSFGVKKSLKKNNNLPSKLIHLKYAVYDWDMKILGLTNRVQTQNKSVLASQRLL